MKAVIQRVAEASVTVDGKVISKIDRGILTLLGVEKGDTEVNLKKMIDKILDLRIFPDVQGKMNLSLKDLSKESPTSVSHLIISQFTLAGDCSQGRRPSFITAEEPAKAKLLYEKAIQYSFEQGLVTLGGEFQADMKVRLLNDGPVTFVLQF